MVVFAIHLEAPELFTTADVGAHQWIIFIQLFNESNIYLYTSQIVKQIMEDGLSQIYLTKLKTPSKYAFKLKTEQ